MSRRSRRLGAKNAKNALLVEDQGTGEETKAMRAGE